jgi:hypothetical protein
MNHVIRPSFMASLLVTVLVFGQWCGKGGTNEVGKPTINPGNSPAAKQPNWVVDKKQVQGDKDTNGWSCVLWIDNIPEGYSLRPPTCKVSINNISTNVLRLWVGSSIETYSNFELLNSKGEQVRKTIKGKQIGTKTDDGQIKEMVKARFKKWVDHRARTPGYIPIRPGQDWHTSISIPDLYEIEQPGEYTLKAQMCMIQRVGGEEYNPELRITWLPRITAKIQIRSGGVAPSRLPHNGPSNLTPK